MQIRLANEAQTLAHRQALLEKLSPYGAFARGLAFVKNEANEPVKAAAGLSPGDKLTLHWADGTVHTQILPQVKQKQK
jgi:exonuclease VII large subunit